MKNIPRKAFTLLEAMVTITIISIIVLVAIPKFLPLIDDFQIKENVLKVEQAIKEARSLAIKKSSLVYIDFSKAYVANGDQGGLMELKLNDGTLMTQIYMDQNILCNAGSTTIADNKIYFDFQGRPTDAAGVPTNFTNSNNEVSISYYSSSMSVVHTKSFNVLPLTGKIQAQ